MAYTKQTWNNGDIITAEKMNHIEDGIAGGTLIVNADIGTATLNKTWQEIYDTIKSGNTAVIVVELEEGGQMVIQEADVIMYATLDTSVIPNEYVIRTGISGVYKTSSADGYPVRTE